MAHKPFWPAEGMGARPQKLLRSTKLPASWTVQQECFTSLCVVVCVTMLMGQLPWGSSALDRHCSLFMVHHGI